MELEEDIALDSDARRSLLLSKRACVLSLLLAGAGPSYAVQGNLENPAANGNVSGIGVVSGWVCDAALIEIVFDNGAPKTASYGTARGDTAAVCGDTDNGFGLLWNYALVGQGQHRVRAYADGVLFADRQFTVGTLGGETFVTGASGSYTLPGFPDSSTQTTIVWNQSAQNFTITGTQTISGPGGTVSLPGLWQGRMVYDRASPGSTCYDANISLTVVDDAFCADEVIDSVTVARDGGGVDSYTFPACDGEIQNGLSTEDIFVFSEEITFALQFGNDGTAAGTWTSNNGSCFGTWSLFKQ